MSWRCYYVRGASARAGVIVSKMGSGGGLGCRMGGGIAGAGCGRGGPSGIVAARAVLSAGRDCKVSGPRGLGCLCIVYL